MSVSSAGLSDDDYLAAMHRMADDFDADTFCYFIGGEVGPVKIGHARDIERRLRELQPGNPMRLRVLASTLGGLTRERAYHFQFHHHRLHGEWFERCSEIEAEIQRLNRSLP